MFYDNIIVYKIWSCSHARDKASDLSQYCFIMPEAQIFLRKIKKDLLVALSYSNMGIAHPQ